QTCSNISRPRPPITTCIRQKATTRRPLTRTESHGEFDQRKMPGSSVNRSLSCSVTSVFVHFDIKNSNTDGGMFHVQQNRGIPNRERFCRVGHIGATEPKPLALVEPMGSLQTLTLDALITAAGGNVLELFTAPAGPGDNDALNLIAPPHAERDR